MTFKPWFKYRNKHCLDIDFIILSIEEYKHAAFTRVRVMYWSRAWSLQQGYPEVVTIKAEHYENWKEVL